MTTASFRLIVRTGPNPGVAFDLTKEVTLIGRDVVNDITIGDPEVSRQHCRITRTPGGDVLEDLGSTNGTFLNGDRLVAPRVLSMGDLLGMGANVTLTYEATSPEAAATMMRPAARVAPPAPPPQARPAQPPPPPAYQPAAAPEPPAEQPPAAAPDRRRWILAGCGCLVLVAACVGVIVFLDAYYPDVIWGPLEPILRSLGF
jgi:hypothetical protein